MNRSEQKEPVASASNPPQATAVATPETKEASSNHANSEVKEKKTKKRKKKSVQTNAKPAKKQLSFNQEDGLSWPIKGDVLMEYSADKEGMDVKASADGIVESVETSEETGRTVSISIGDGFTVVYGQLKDISVSKGDMVSEGQVLGKIAEPTKYYKEEGTNLYFQVKENKTTVNPMLLLQ